MNDSGNDTTPEARDDETERKYVAPELSKCDLRLTKIINGVADGAS